ncbi:MAG: GNAT family N-acetyltransferase [Pseudomonadota bacterium]
MIIRPTEERDIAGIVAVLSALVDAGKRTNPSDAVFVRDNYVAHPDRIASHVAIDQTGTVLGFQSLKRAGIGNRYDTPAGWGQIGTHIHPAAARRGIGKALFAATRPAASAAGLPAIEAFIGATNTEGLAYYEAMGFSTYRRAKGAIAKCYPLG